MNIYWYSQIKTATIFAAAYPWVFFIVALTSLPGNSSAGDSSSSQNYPYLAGSLFFLAFSIPSLIPVLAAARPIERRMVSAKVSEELGLLLEDQGEDEVSGESAFPKLIADPLGARRKDLAEIADHLSDTAKELDARQMRGFSPHPISTLLRGVSHSIHQFLGSEESLQGSVPDGLRETLVMTLALLSVRRDPDLYHSLAQRVAAFDSDGLPAVELIEKPPSWMSILAARTLASIPRITVAVIGMAAIVAIIIASILTILHRMNLEELLRYLR